MAIEPMDDDNALDATCVSNISDCPIFSRRTLKGMEFTLQPGCPPSLTRATRTAHGPRDFEFRECSRLAVSRITITSATIRRSPKNFPSLRRNYLLHTLATSEKAGKGHIWHPRPWDRTKTECFPQVTRE